jgi:iron-sulfur cluster assembly protein
MSIVTVTESAAERIRHLLAEDGKLESHALRMKVIGGGCSGLQYQLSFDDAETARDTRYQSGGVALLIDEKSALFLVGCTLDYVDGLMETGFKIQNPNASNTCGCGQSFAA